MVTILDIAREAGVSHGTVSNVLNGKGNVSSKRMELVFKAAEKLGYHLNNNAKTLRSGKSNTIILILPSIALMEYGIFYEKALKEARSKDYDIKLYCTYDNPIQERQVIKEIIKERPASILTVSALDDAAEYYNQLTVQKEDIIFLNRKLKNATEYIAFDYRQAGIDISAYINRHVKGKIGIFIGDEQFSNEKELKNTLKEQLVHEHIHVCSSTLSHEYEDAFHMVNEQVYDCIITTNLSKANLLKKAYHYGADQQVPKIITLAPLNDLHSETIKYYYQDFGYLGERIIRHIIKKVQLNDQGLNKLYSNYGFIQTNWKQKNQQSTLSILTIESPATFALKKVIKHFEKYTNCKVQLDIKSYNEVFRIIEDPDRWKAYDLIRLDIAGYSWYGEKIYQPLSNRHSEIDSFIESMPDFLRDTYAEINETAYAVPFDISIQMLFYRKDLFEHDIVKRKFFEKTKSELHIPKTFEEYNKILTFFNEQNFEQIKGVTGSTMISGNAETIAAEYLLRYYSLGGNILNCSMIELDKKTAIEAMKFLYNDYHQSTVIDSSWWGKEVQHFVAGHSFMVIGFMNHLSVVSQSTIKDSIGIANVPGNTPLLGGGMIGITKETTKEREAIEFLTWLNSTEISEQINLLGGNVASYFLTKSSVVKTMYPWLAKAVKTMKNGKRETIFRNGQSLDLKHTEEVIGKYIQKLMNEHTPNFDQCLENINEELRIRQTQLLEQR